MIAPPRDRSVSDLMHTFAHTANLSQREHTSVLRASIHSAMGGFCGHDDMVNECIELGIVPVPYVARSRDITPHVVHTVTQATLRGSMRHSLEASEEMRDRLRALRAECDTALESHRQCDEQNARVAMWRRRLGATQCNTDGRLLYSDFGVDSAFLAALVAARPSYAKLEDGEAERLYARELFNHHGGDAAVRSYYGGAIARCLARLNGVSLDVLYCQFGMCTRDIYQHDATTATACRTCMRSLFCPTCVHITQQASVLPYCRQCVRMSTARIVYDTGSGKKPQEAIDLQNMNGTGRQRLLSNGAERVLAQHYISLQMQHYNQAAAAAAQQQPPQ